MAKPPSGKKPDKAAQKRKMDAAKRKVEQEVKKLRDKTKPRAEEAKQLKAEKDAAKKGKVPSPDGKARIKEIDLKLKDFEKYFQREAGIASGRIQKILEMEVPDDKEEVKVWQKGMEPWYRDMINKEPGWKLTDKLRANGSLSIKDKKVKIEISGKF